MDFFKQLFTAESLLEGQLLLIDKPFGWTSFQVVNKIRWHLKKQADLKKCSHTSPASGPHHFDGF